MVNVHVMYPFACVTASWEPNSRLPRKGVLIVRVQKILFAYLPVEQAKLPERIIIIIITITIRKEDEEEEEGTKEKKSENLFRKEGRKTREKKKLTHDWLSFRCTILRICMLVPIPTVLISITSWLAWRLNTSNNLFKLRMYCCVKCLFAFFLNYYMWSSLMIFTFSWNNDSNVWQWTNICPGI